MSAPDPMAEIRASFFLECEELLESLQDGLTAMEGGASDSETINVCFRAVHSIKGGAGAFGLDDLVRFAHRYETVMDEMRAGRLSADPEAMRLFFRAADVLFDLVRAARDGASLDESDVEATLSELEGLAGGSPETEGGAETVEFTPMTLSLDLPGLDSSPDEAGADPGWDIAFRPERDLFVTGNEPRHLIAALSEFGPLETRCDISAVPTLWDLDPEESYLSWAMTLETDVDRDRVAEVFDFVDGVCQLDISPRSPEAAEAATLEDGSSADPASALPNPEPEPATVPVAETPAPAPVAAAAAAAGQMSPAPASPQEETAKPRQTVRVDLDRIDRMVNLVGELVINQAMLTQSVAEMGIPANSPVSHGLEEFMQLTRDIQDSVMMIRAQPVKSLFQRMARIVREASASVDKRVRLVTEGEATEIDKTVIERLSDPLTHMVRNAVDHGLESRDKRVAAGKPDEGVVRLSAAHRSGRVIIEVSDDGAGINRPKVKQIAEEKGLIAPGLPLSDSEIDNLLFLPGFSTASEVSDLSGRGVGMDVVRSSIQSLGGRIAISSEPGRGTTLQISLPLTLAVLDGMVVRVAGETIVVPLGSIVETLTLAGSEIRHLGPRTSVIHIRDSFVPLLDLGAELGYRTPLGTYDSSVVLLIAKEDGSRSALIVDEIQEQRQVVIKGLQESYGHVPGIAAATILGDGQVALILDPVDLMARASGATRAAADLTVIPDRDPSAEESLQAG
ncbi:chemotaxis protein CheA [Roseicyclus sp. F158]|uniref:Chemotaxis protein CheA n=1 Tax=Tropicimonas omnivorans TaxID=3075590 RepID=A0ABU3DJG4_9RHOB|nr:chemotaxis protein CheA [Roseicyclus sp. F158]MDT0683861.1 chemotaxis protein CheA [Roseicyclus sp. F158]